MKSIIAASVFIWCIMLGCGPALEATAAPQKTRLMVRTDSPRLLHRGVYGFNTNMMHGIYSYRDREIVEMVRALKPISLRFPGGTVGNFYHFEISGFRKQELTGFTAKPGTWLLKDYERLQEKYRGQLPFDDFMVLCRQFGIEPYVTLNLYTGSPLESAAWVKYANEKGYKVAGWELGNELFLPFYRDRIKDVKGYIATAKKHAAAMRAVDPGVRVAVVAHDGSRDLRAEQLGNRWNERLGREDFFDAFILHPYVDLVKNGFVIGKNFEDARSRLFEVSDALMDRAINNRKYFAGKELWITEWNIVFKNEMELSDTLLHALFCGDFFIRMVNTDFVANAAYHVLHGGWNGFPVVSTSDGVDIKRAAYYVFDLIKDAMSGSKNRYSVKVESGPVLKQSNSFASGPVPGLTVTAVGQDKKIFLLFTNRTSTPVPAELTVDGAKYQGSITLKYISAPDLQATGKDNKIRIMETKPDEAGNLMLPANGFGLIELM